MPKKITLENLATQIAKGLSDIETKIEKGFGSADLKFASLETRIDGLDARMDRGFAALATDIADIRNDMPTKDQIVALHTQVNAIETEIRGMKHVKVQARIADLEEEVFGARGSKHP